MACLVVIGEGVAATAFLYALMQNGKVDQFSSIIQVASDALAPATSFRSTALAALRGTRRGLSPLGDEIVSMWHYTHPLLKEQAWSGVTAVKLHSWVYSDKAERRYGHLPQISRSYFASKRPPRSIHEEDAWIIDPATLLASVPRPSLQKRQQLVTSLKPEGDQWQVGLLGGETLLADKVVLATGAWSQWSHELLADSPLAEMKSVQGSYYQWGEVDFGAKSFALGVEGVVCVYHADRRRLLLGATSVNGDDSFIPAKPELAAMARDFSQRVEITLPSAEPQILTGIRAQTKGRRPWTGELRKNLYAIGGLYKTGWVTAWPLGSQLAQKI